LFLQIRNKLKQLKLSNKAVWDREHAREAAGGGVETPWYVRAVYYSLCLFLDVAYDNRWAAGASCDMAVLCLLVLCAIRCSGAKADSTFVVRCKQQLRSRAGPCKLGWATRHHYQVT
jgi:hypothetical protein